MSGITDHMLFGIFIIVTTFYIGLFISRKLKTPLANPLLISVILCLIVLRTFHISYDSFYQGGQFVNMFVFPATVAIGVSIYRQMKILKKEFIPIFLGCLLSSLCSMGTTLALCKVFGLDEKITMSLLPKSITTAIALDVSTRLNGVTSVTLLVVMLSGILGAVINPLIIKALRFKDAVAVGVAMGSVSHAIGTAKAMELGELEGTVSGVSIGVTGLITVVITIFL